MRAVGGELISGGAGAETSVAVAGRAVAGDAVGVVGDGTGPGDGVAGGSEIVAVLGSGAADEGVDGVALRPPVVGFGVLGQLMDGELLGGVGDRGAGEEILGVGVVAERPGVDGVAGDDVGVVGAEGVE